MDKNRKNLNHNDFKKNSRALHLAVLILTHYHNKDRPKIPVPPCFIDLI